MSNQGETIQGQDKATEAKPLENAFENVTKSVNPRLAFLEVFKNPMTALSIALGLIFLGLLLPFTVGLRDPDWQPASAGFWMIAGPCFIFLLLLLGWYKGLRLLAAHRIDSNYVKRIDQELIAIKNLGSRISLDEVKARCRLTGKRHRRQTISEKMFEHIHAEALDNRFESSILVVQPFLEKWEMHLFNIQHAQRYALNMGILGTFIGLIIGLTDLQEQLANLPARADSGSLFTHHLTDILGTLFSGLNLAFGTSVAGLQVAIILGFFLIYLRGKLTQHYEAMEKLAVDLLSVVRSAINDASLLAALEEIPASLSAVRHELNNHGKVISQEVRDTARLISSQNQHINHALKQQQKAGVRFSKFLRDFSATLRNLENNTDNFHRSLALQFQKGLNTLGTTLAERENLAYKELDSLVAAAKESLETNKQNLSDTLAGIKKTLTGENKLLFDPISAVLREIATEFQLEHQQHKASIDQIISETKTLIAHGIEQLKKHTDDLYQSSLNEHHLLHEELEKAGTSLSRELHVAAGTLKQTLDGLTLETLIQQMTANLDQRLQHQDQVLDGLSLRTGKQWDAMIRELQAMGSNLNAKLGQESLTVKDLNKGFEEQNKKIRKNHEALLKNLQPKQKRGRIGDFWNKTKNRLLSGFSKKA